MTPKSLIGLVVVTAVAVAAAAVVAGGNAAGSAVADRGHLLLPDLFQKSEAIVGVAVTAGKTTTTVSRDGDRFLDASGYPVKFDVVRGLVASLSTLTIEEGKTDKPDRYADIGLAAPDAATGGATEVALLDKAGKPVVTVFAGTKDLTVGGSRGGQFVRLDGEATSYLVRGAVDAPGSRADWFDTRISDIKPTDLARIILNGPADSVVYFAPSGDKMLPTGLPFGREADEGKANRVAAFLQAFDFNDVRKATPVSIPNAARIRYETKDGLAVTVTDVPATTDADKGWVRVVAEAMDPKAAEAAKAINAKAAGFEFKVNSIHAEMFGWTMDTLVKPS